MTGTLAYICLWLATLACAVGFASGKRSLELVGNVAAWVALIALGLGLLGRGLRAGHWPFASPYEFALAFVWGTLLIYLLLEWTVETPIGGAFILPIPLAVFTYALAFISPADKVARPLSPALQSEWLVLHGVAGLLAYGAFACAGGLAAMYLVRDYRARREGKADPPSLEQLDHLIWRAVALGFPTMTLLIITGAIWAQTAWGSYWNWDIKEVWALITWFVYLLFLHARVLGGWRGRPVAFIALAGLAAVLFTFLGVGWLARQVQVQSLHVF
jgi:cytochrome c-type biogenesis protein CcsB